MEVDVIFGVDVFGACAATVDYISQTLFRMVVTAEPGAANG
jgi:hypothetical protein